MTPTVTPLRQRMLDDMKLRNLAPGTALVHGGWRRSDERRRQGVC
jgi:hypothetical protein